ASGSGLSRRRGWRRRPRPARGAARSFGSWRDVTARLSRVPAAALAGTARRGSSADLLPVDQDHVDVTGACRAHRDVPKSPANDHEAHEPAAAVLLARMAEDIHARSVAPGAATGH